MPLGGGGGGGIFLIVELNPFNVDELIVLEEELSCDVAGDAALSLKYLSRLLVLLLLNVDVSDGSSNRLFPVVTLCKDPSWALLVRTVRLSLGTRVMRRKDGDESR